MSEKNVVRQDVVQIGFETDLKSLTKLTDGMDDLKKSVAGVGEQDGLDKAKEGAEGLTKSSDKATSSLKDLGKVSLSKLNDGIDKIGTSLTKGVVKAAGLAYNGLKKVAGVSFKALIAGAGAVAGAVGKAVSEYADYEQLVGGVETLFKKSSGTVQKYANEAYKTAGLSANEYMDSVTGFSASLLQSVGGDTDKAAKLANQAIIDMSDNANKMGTSMESIQTAYQGFAKQNYTMLDNLKLGYGGTKEEMARLIKDAAKLDKSVDASSMSYANIVKAIHAVQTNLDITGTTSKEASETISGSLYAMKSAWNNLMPALIQGGDSFDDCVKNLVKTTKTFAKNIMPAIKSGLKGVGSLLTELSPIIAKELPSLMDDILPPLVDAAGNLIGGLVQAIPKFIPTLANAVVNVITGLAQVIVENAPAIVNAAKEAVVQVAKAIYEGFTGKEMSGEMFSTLKSNVDTVFNSIKNIIKGVLDFGKKLMSGLAPVLSFIGGLAISVFGWIGDNINWLLPLVGGLVAAFWAYKAVMVAVKVITTIVTTVQTIMATVCGTASAAAAAGTTAVGTAAATSAPQILAFAAAILAVGVSIFLICAGFTLLIQSSIALANAGWGAIAVFAGLIIVIAALTVGLAILGPVLTAGAIGFIALGAAVLMVGAGFALIGAGALMAASGLQIVAMVLPIVAMFGLQSAVSLTALGVSLLAFGAGATVGGAGAMVLGAGLMIVAAALVVIAASFAIITASFMAMTLLITIFATAASMLPAMFAALVPQMMMFAVALTPLSVALTAAVVPLTLFTSLVAVLAVSFTVLALASTVVFVMLTGVALAVTIINTQLMLMVTLFSVVALSVTILTTALLPLPLVFSALILPITIFTAILTPLTLLFVTLALSATVFTVSITALTVVMTLLNAMMLIFVASITMLVGLFSVVNLLVVSFSATLLILTATLTILTPLLLVFTTALLPLTGVMLALVAPTILFTGTMAALMAVFVILSPLAMLFAMAMMILGPIFALLGVSTPIFEKALKPLPERFTAMLIPTALLAAALAPLSAEFLALAVSAVTLLAGFIGLVATSTALSLLLARLISSSIILVTAFNLLGVGSNRLSALLVPLTMALLTMITPLKRVSDSFVEFSISSGIAATSASVMRVSFAQMVVYITATVAVLIILLKMLKSVGEAFTKIAKTPTIFNSSIILMTSRTTAALSVMIVMLKVFGTQVESLVVNISSKVSRIVDNSIANIVKRMRTLPIQMGIAIKGSGGSLSDAFVSIWKNAVKATVAPVNKLIDGANWVLKQFGSNKTVASWKAYANGTDGHKGGNALVNDGRGAELIQMPNGQMFIPQGRNVFIPNAPAGMKVLSAEQTARLFGRKSPTFKYADGTGNFDVMDFVDNPKGLVEKVDKKYVTYDTSNDLALNAGKGLVSKVEEQMIPWVKNLFEKYGSKSIASYVAGKGVSQWKSTVIQALKMEGLYSEENVKRTLFQMQTESGGNPRAINLWDSNAKKGIPSKGLMQVIDPTFQAYARAGYNKNIYDPLSNILAAIRYAVSRYGSLAKAFKGHGYENGGIATKPSIFGENGPEIAIPLSKGKRKRGLDLWEKTGSLFGAGFDEYTPENSVVNNNTTTQNNTYSPQFTLNMNGASATESNKRVVKKWVKESMTEMFKSMGNSDLELIEV